MMMKKDTLYIISLLIAPLFFSCNKFIEIEPKGYSIPTTVQDFSLLLDGVDLTMAFPTELEMMTDNYYDPILDTTVPFSASSESNAYLWYPEIFPAEESYSIPWALFYKNIFTYNVVINNIDKATLGDAKEKASIRSQALFGRAFTNWYLVNIYSKQYNAATAKTDPGIPLVISADVNTPLPGRGTVEGCYDFILNDLKEALKDLPISASTNFRGTKAAAYGLLARAYLHLRKFNESVNAATKALELNDFIANYHAVVDAQGNGVFKINDKDFFHAFKQRDRQVLYNEMFNRYTRGFEFNVISPGLDSLLALDDTRRCYLKYDPSVNAYEVATGYIRVSIGITTPEMYLIRAEANTRAGNLAPALDDLNKLRKNRIDPATFEPFASTDKKELIQKILTEKRVEFYFKNMRWFETRRLSVDPEFAFTTYHYFLDGSRIALPPTSNRWVLRIPHNALTENITQNP